MNRRFPIAILSTLLVAIGAITASPAVADITPLPPVSFQQVAISQHLDRSGHISITVSASYVDPYDNGVSIIAAIVDGHHMALVPSIIKTYSQDVPGGTSAPHRWVLTLKLSRKQTARLRALRQPLFISGYYSVEFAGRIVYSHPATLIRLHLNAPKAA